MAGRRGARRRFERWPAYRSADRRGALARRYLSWNRGTDRITLMLTFQERLSEVRERIHKACARAHRDPASVKLLAVTKVFGPEVIVEAHRAGLREFGENYVQEMERKADAVASLEGARFHLIGHLQSNKTKKAAQLFASIDTVDTPKLAARLDAEGKDLDVTIEVKLSEE